MSVWRSLNGIVEVEISSASPAQLLTVLNERNVSLFDIRYVDDLTVRFKLSRSDYGRMFLVVKKRGDIVKIIARGGTYWVLKGLLKRPILLMGVLLLGILIVYLPTRVLFVSVSGNERIPTRLILEKATECGIGFGSSRKEVCSEKIKNSLLSAVPELQWAGINTYGCAAVISVRERSDSNVEKPAAGISSIVADRDGIITDMTVLRGTALCKVGQAVTQGQVLVSGYTDYGLCIKGTSANAEIIAQTGRVLSVSTITNYQNRGVPLSSKVRFSLLVGKKLINFYNDSGISGAECVRMYSESYLTLPGGFVLPIALVTERYVYYQMEQAHLTENESFLWMEKSAQDYLYSQMLSGEILKSNTSLELLDGVCKFNGIYRCREMIGRIRREEIVR